MRGRSHTNQSWTKIPLTWWFVGQSSSSAILSPYHLPDVIAFPVCKWRFTEPCGFAPPRTLPDLVKKAAQTISWRLVGVLRIFYACHSVVRQCGLWITKKTLICFIEDVPKWIHLVPAVKRPSIQWKSWIAWIRWSKLIPSHVGSESVGFARYKASRCWRVLFWHLASVSAFSVLAQRMFFLRSL